MSQKDDLKIVLKNRAKAQAGIVLRTKYGIYCALPSGGVMQVAERSEYLSALTAVNGELYEGGYGHRQKEFESQSGVIRKTLTGEVVGRRATPPNQFAVLNGTLYDGGTLNEDICETLENRPVARRKKYVNALHAHNGVLYDGGDDNIIYDTLKNEGVAKREHHIVSLETHKGKLYDGDYDGGVVETFGGERIAFSRAPWVKLLRSHGGALYCGSHFGVYDVFGNRKIADRGDATVSALLSHNGVLYDASDIGVCNTLKDHEGTNPLWQVKDGKGVTVKIEQMIGVDWALWEKLLKVAEEKAAEALASSKKQKRISWR